MPGRKSCATGSEDIYASLDTLCEVISIIERDYIEIVPPSRLIHNALRGVLRSLDGYSYLNVPLREKAGEPPGGEGNATQPEAARGTLGMEVAYKGGLLTVIAAYEGGPAWKQGVVHDDKIILIDETPVAEYTHAELMRIFHGEITKSYALSIARKGNKEFVKVEIPPGDILLPPLEVSTLAEEGIALLRVRRFEKGVQEILSARLQEYARRDRYDTIIDLRNCPGSEIPAAIESADLFLEKDTLITRLEGRVEGLPHDYRSRKAPVNDKGILLLLINGGTCGAAEVFAGALHATKRGLLLGEKSFGQAFQEDSFPLSDASEIRLITGIYTTPGGTAYQEKGIEPDIEAPAAHGLIPASPDEIPEEKGKDITSEKEDSLQQDPLVQRAVDLIKAIRITHREGRN